MYSTAFWCLSFYCFFFWLYCLTTVTPFSVLSQNEEKAGNFDLAGSWTSRNKNAVFFRRNSNPLEIFQLQPKRETSSSSLGDRRQCPCL